MLMKLEDTARYAGLLLAPAEGFGLCPRLFLPFRQKKELIMLFWCPVVTLVTFSSNLRNFERNAKKPTKIQFFFKINYKKNQKLQKNKNKKYKKKQKIKKNPNKSKQKSKNP